MKPKAYSVTFNSLKNERKLPPSFHFIKPAFGEGVAYIMSF